MRVGSGREETDLDDRRLSTFSCSKQQQLHLISHLLAVLRENLLDRSAGNKGGSARLHEVDGTGNQEGRRTGKGREDNSLALLRLFVDVGSTSTAAHVVLVEREEGGENRRRSAESSVASRKAEKRG